MEVTLSKNEEMLAAALSDGSLKQYELAKEKLLKEKRASLEAEQAKKSEQENEQEKAVITKSDFIKMSPWEQAEVLRDNPGLMKQFKKEVLA